MDILVSSCEIIITFFQSSENIPQEFSREVAVNDLKELARMFEGQGRLDSSTLKTVEDFLVSFPCQ